MAAYRRVYDSHHLQADCQEPGSAPEPYARYSSMGYLYLFTQWAGTTKVKPIWILLKQESVGGSGISWAVCKSAPRSNHASTTPLSFIQAGCPSCHPANSGKALKAAIDRSLRPARPAAVKLRVCCCGPVLGQTDRRTDTVPLHRPCCT